LHKGENGLGHGIQKTVYIQILCIVNTNKTVAEQSGGIAVKRFELMPGRKADKTKFT
jgi:hypothetical protein